MSTQNRHDRWARRWEAMTYDTMPKRRCDYSRPWMRGWSRIRRIMYWADIAKKDGVEQALWDRYTREYYLVKKRYA